MLDTHDRPGLDTPLFERDAEVAAIDEALASARAGAGRVVLLSGSPGIGKSALVDLARRQASGAGMGVLAAAGGELEQDFSFGVVRRLFAGLEREPGVAGLGDPAARAAQVLDDLRAGAADRSAELVNDLFWLTTDVAAVTPLLVAVDDAGWADEPSLRFLLYLARRIAELPVALALAVRDRERTPATELLAQLDPSAAHRLPLRPLSEGASAQLIRTIVPDAGDDVTAACFEATDGKPFLLTELGTELVASGLPATRESVDRLAEETPESVVHAVARRVGRLAPDCVAVLEAAAILGESATLGFVAELAGLDPATAAAAAEPLVQLELVQPRLPLHLAHPLVASAVRARIPPVRRATLHRRAAQVLREHGMPVEQLAAHLLASPRTGDPGVVEDLRQAARRALAHGAPQSAARYLRRALEEPPARDARAGVLHELGRAEAFAGEPTAAQRLEEALGLVAAERDRAETLRALANVLVRQGRLAEAAAALREGIVALDASGDELAVQMRAEHARLLLLRPDLETEAEPMPEPPPADRTDLSLAERSWLASLAVTGLFASEPARDVVELAERAYGGGALLEQETADGTALYGVTMALVGAGALRRAVAVGSAALDDARRRGSVLAFATASFWRGRAQLLRGRLPDAVADLEAALGARRHGWRQHLPVACGVLALARIETGDRAGALAALAEVEEGDWTGDIQWGVWLWARGALELLDGRPAAARDAFARWGERMAGVANPALSAAWRSHLALAAVQLGDRDEALRLAGAEVEAARRFGAPHVLGAALRALALVQEDERERLALLEESVTVLEGSDAELEGLRSLVELGAALRRTRRAGAAREPLGRALDRAHALGATQLADRAEEELRATGLRPRRRALTGAGSLTPGERRVTQMAAAGMSNREIAEALFVSPKAVQWHLGNAYRKLGVSSRRELSGALGPAPDEDPAAA